MIMQKVALRKDGVASLFSCNRVIIRFVVVGNGGVVRVWRDIRRRCRIKWRGVRWLRGVGAIDLFVVLYKIRANYFCI